MVYLFDIDGTLVLTGGAGAIALNAVFRACYGVDDAMDDIRPGGKTDPLIVAEIFEARLGRAPTADEITAVLADYVPRLYEAVAASTRFRIMPAVFEILDFLDAQDGVHLGIATGNIQRGAQAKLERPDLWRRFRFGGYGDDDADRAALVARAIERARIAAGVAFGPQDIVVVGDTPRDVAAARACGAVAVAVATGQATRAELEACGADIVIDTLAELRAWHEAARANR